MRLKIECTNIPRGGFRLCPKGKGRRQPSPIGVNNADGITPFADEESGRGNGLVRLKIECTNTCMSERDGSAPALRVHHL